MRLAEVRLQEGESLENALRRFKRKVQQEDIIKEVKRHSFYLKPAEPDTLLDTFAHPYRISTATTRFGTLRAGP
jgi:small subunit ribosomal protein S21